MPILLFNDIAYGLVRVSNYNRNPNTNTSSICS